MANSLMSIKVIGAKQLRRDINRAKRTDLKDELKKAHKDIASEVARTAQRKAPFASGVLSSSIRGLGSVTKAQVAAGGARKAPYAGVIHYGTPDGKRRPQPFLLEAVSEDFPKIIRALEGRYDNISRKLSSRGTGQF